jgi:hypothetical protein
MTAEDSTLVAVAMFSAGALIGASAVVGVYGVLLARRSSMAGLQVIAIWFVISALFGAIALPWLAPGWAVAVAALGALCAALPVALIVRSRWRCEDERAER